jgi:ketopantoate reductase
MIIIGQGRVGGGLIRRADRVGVATKPVTRTAGWSQIRGDGAGPILVCTNADDLACVIDATPEQRRQDLVFVQNGMLNTHLKELGRAANTRGLLYFAVPTRGVEPEPGGESIFTGPHAESMANWFHAIELAADAVSADAFSNEMASKLIWNCVFGLLCDVHDAPVGRICSHHRDAVDALAQELISVINAGIHTSLEPQATILDLVAYSESIPDYQGTLKQWPWRNGWFVNTAKTLGRPTPIHDDFLLGRRPDGR